MKTLAHVVSGSGEPTVVYLHGILMDHTMFDQVITGLSGTHIRLDLPGHGASAPMAPHDSLATHVAAVEATLAHLDITCAVFVGHSWGGMVTARLAQRRPDLVRAAVLSNTPWQRTGGLARLGFQAQRALLAAGLSPSLYGRIAASSLVGAQTRAADPSVASGVAARAAGMGRRQIRRTLRSVILDPGDAERRLRSLTVPWLAVAGEDDYVIAGSARSRLAGLADLEVVPGGHSTPLEHPDVVRAAVTRMAEVSSAER